MIIYRCAWHATTPYIIRTVDDGLMELMLSDGMCADCADRVRAEAGLPPRDDSQSRTRDPRRKENAA